MGKTKKKERAKGTTGVDAAAIQKKGVDLQAFKITSDAWTQFYRTNEGKNRLRRMRGLANMRIARYKALQRGEFLNSMSDKELYTAWKANQNKDFDVVEK